MTKDIATVKAALDLLHEIKAQLRTHVEFDHATRLMAAVGDMAEAARAYVETALSSPPAIDLEGLIRVLNQARCLEDRTVGNRELANRIMEFLSVPKAPADLVELKADALSEVSFRTTDHHNAEDVGFGAAIMFDHLAATGKLGGDDLGELLNGLPDGVEMEIFRDGEEWFCTITGEGFKSEVIANTAALAIKSAMEKMEEGE